MTAGVATSGLGVTGFRGATCKLGDCIGCTLLFATQMSAATVTTTGRLHVLKDSFTCSALAEMPGAGILEKPQRPPPTHDEEGFLKKAPMLLNF